MEPVWAPNSLFLANIVKLVGVSVSCGTETNNTTASLEKRSIFWASCPPRVSERERGEKTALWLKGLSRDLLSICESESQLDLGLGMKPAKTDVHHRPWCPNGVRFCRSSVWEPLFNWWTLGFPSSPLLPVVVGLWSLSLTTFNV